MTLLYVFPHPDDESFGPVPAIARQLREGHRVHLLTLTKGGATKQREKLGLSVEQMDEVRAAEMRRVEATLGLSGFTLLDFPDGGLKHLDPREVERAVADEVRRVQPDVLVTYAVYGNSGHPDHLVAHAAVKRVFCELRETQPRAPRRLALFTLVEGAIKESAGDLRGSPRADVGAVVRGAPEDFAQGEAALACYESYRETVEAHRPLEQVREGVAFELFGERHEAPLASLTEGL